MDVGDGDEGPGEAIDCGRVGALPEGGAGQRFIASRWDADVADDRYAYRGAASRVEAAGGRHEGEVHADDVRVVSAVLGDNGHGSRQVRNAGA